jgi:hypothetical protein
LEKSKLTARSAQASNTANAQIDDNLPNLGEIIKGVALELDAAWV